MIVPMKRLTLIGMKSDEEAILRELQKLGAVEVLSTRDAESAELDSLNAKRDRIEQARGALKPFYKKPKLQAPPVCTAEELKKSLDESAALCAEVEELERELAAKKAEKDKHIATAAGLEPFKKLDTPIESIRSSKHIRYIAGTADAKALAVIGELGAVLGCDIALEVFEGEGENAPSGVIIACYDIYKDAALRALKESSFQEYTFPHLTGTPKEAIGRELEEAARLEKECAALAEELSAKGARRTELDRAADAADIERSLETSRTALDETEYAFVLDGWLRADKRDEVELAVASVSDAFSIDTRDPEDDETPPSLLKNSRFVEPYESIVEMYALPSYKGVDATAALAPFYFLFFGMMLSDSGYGILLFVGGLLFSKLLRPKGNMGKLVRVITYGGLSAMLCGPLIGTFFGLDFDAILGTVEIFPLICDPMIDVMTMMLISCGLGLIHMFVGIGIKMYMCFREGDWQSAIFDQLSWMLLLVGLISLIAFPTIKTVALTLTILGAGMMLIFAGRPSKNPIKRLTKGLGALYGITGYLSDILSYVRIFALGLVSGAMGMVFNLIGDLVYSAFGGLGFIGVILGAVFAGAIIVALHVFSLFINTLGAYAHTARLQFIEFFGKFYEAGGVPFKPLARNTKNVELAKDGK